jgi:cyclophilin family peptidyl-prolyl cis-trans isomerase
LAACLAFPGLAGRAASAQTAPSTFTSRDSALVARILLAEDRRDSSDAALTEGASHGNARIQQLALRAAARIRDPIFSTRDQLPPLAVPPAYADPAWRLRYRALATAPVECAALRVALADSAWPVRLRAADLTTPACASDTTLIRTLQAWVAAPPSRGARRHGAASWHPAAHALVALARIAPDAARAALPRVAASRIPWLRTYAARAAGELADTAVLRRLARDQNDNVKEAAIDALSKLVGHAGDGLYKAALHASGYQAVRAGARALAGSPRGEEMLVAALSAARRLRRDSSETSRDARLAVIERIAEFIRFGTRADERAILALNMDFDCEVGRALESIKTRVEIVAGCGRPLPVTLPPDAVALALGREVRLRVTLADSSGGGSFTVRLRGDVAPIMAARVLALARSHYYDGLTWLRVEPDFVVQGGGRGANEFVGYPRFFRDELGTVPHVRGTVGMSTRGHDTGDAQWFVNLKDNPRLGRDYTVFAEVVDGMAVVDGILEGDVIASIREERPR